MWDWRIAPKYLKGGHDHGRLAKMSYLWQVLHWEG